MPVITDYNTLKAWLIDSPPEFACVLASRAALRVMPLFAEALHDDATVRRANILLSGFRTLLIADFVSVFPKRVSEIRNDARTAGKKAKDSVSEVANNAQMSVIETIEAVPDEHFLIHEIQADVKAIRIAEYAVYAAVHAVQVAVDTVDASNGVASSQAAFEAAIDTIETALNAVDSAHGYTDLLGDTENCPDNESESATHIAGFWKAIELDAVLLDTVRGASSDSVELAASLSGRALWLDGIPVWVGRKLADLKDNLPEDEGWGVWLDWYEARLAGRSSSATMERALTSIPQKDWEQGPAYVNEIIVELIRTQPDPLVSAIAFGLEQIDAVKEVIDLEQHSVRIRNNLSGDPSQAIEATKKMLEATMKTILRERGIEIEELNTFKFPVLTGRCFSELGLTGDSSPTTESEKYLLKIANNAKRMIITLNDFRNLAGIGHGHVVGAEPRVTEADANLVASTGFILAAWLARHHKRN